ncbi:MAG: hypothetical protein DMD49_13430, partial [Gemmatimonadetes bacterium]
MLVISASTTVTGAAGVRPRHLVRTDEVVPSTQHLLTQHDTALQRRGQRSQFLGVHRCGDPPQRIGVNGLVFEVVGDAVCERCKAPQRTRQRAGSDIAPLVGLRG